MPFSLGVYSDLNAKLKGMYAKKIKRESLEELLKQSSSIQVIALLKSLNTAFSDLESEPERVKIKIFLDNGLIKDIQKINRYLNQKDREIFADFISDYEIRCIKTVFRKLQSENRINEHFYEIKNWVDGIFKDLRGLETVTSYDEFFGFIDRTKKYASVFAQAEKNTEDLNFFEIENCLDKFYFEQMMKKAKSCSSTLEDMLGRKIDLNNIIWIYREKKNYTFSDWQVKNTLVSVQYRLQKAELEKLIQANNEAELIDTLKETVYAKYIPFDDMQNLESNVDRYLYKVYQNYFRKGRFGIDTVCAYVNMMELENNNIMNIVEGIRYNLPKEEIRQMLV